MEISIKWRNGSKWEHFDLSEINHMSRTHAINLFSGNIQVVAKQDDTYIVNREELKTKYAKKGSKVLLFSELQHSQEKFGEQGFMVRGM